MLKVIAIALPLLIGWFAWSVTAALSDGIYPLGRVDMLEKLLFWAPILGFCVPMAVRGFATRRSLAALWLLALAPAFGFANNLFFVVMAPGGTRAKADGISSGWTLAVMWLVPFAVISIRLILQRVRSRRPPLP
ncbi:MAG: hypothetical protein V4843_08515 [Pseudomonadota bacterium]